MIDVFAGGTWGYRLGQATFDLIFPLVGALLLSVGLYRRRAYNSNSNDDIDDGEFDGGEFDDGDPYDVFDGRDEDLPPRQPRPRGNGTVLIVVGVVVVLLGAKQVIADLLPARTLPLQHTVEVGQGHSLVSKGHTSVRMDVVSISEWTAKSRDALVQCGSLA